MAVNYDPSRYIQDFSWVGDIGKTLGSFASEIPELLEMNKSIHENNKFKEMSYSGMSQFLDNFDENAVSNVASSLGIESNDIELARTKLKEMIPKYTDSMDNKAYGKQLVESFVVPLTKAAYSKAGGGSMTPGQLMAMIPGQFTDPFAETTFGKEVKSDSDYGKSVEREQSEYDTGMNRKFGTGGEVEKEREASLETDKQKTGVKREDDLKVSNEVQELLSKSQDSISILKSPEFNEYSSEAREKAYTVALDREKNVSDQSIKERQLQWQKDKEKGDALPKIYDQTKLTEKLIAVNKDVSMLNDRLRKIKDKNSEEYVTTKLTIDKAKSMIRVYEGALKYLEKNPTATQEKINEAQSIAQSNINPEDEQGFIKKWNNNEYGSGINPFLIGKEDDLKRFKKDYNNRFGKDPTVEKTKDGYKIIPQFGNIKTFDSISPTVTDNTSAITDRQAMINALREAIEAKKAGK